MKTLFERDFSRLIRLQSPGDIATPYAIHPAAVASLDREKPLAIKEAMDWFSRGLSAFGAFSAGALSLYGLLRRKKTCKPADYCAEIRKLDLIAHGAQVESTTPIQPKELVP